MLKNKFFLPSVIFLIITIIYFLSSPGLTYYDYFSRLSHSFLEGKLYLTDHPAWLNELIPVRDKYYVVYPPMPAILLSPLNLIFGDVSQTTLSIILGGINASLVFVLFRRIGANLSTNLIITLFFALGTNHWYLASVGSAWFIAHIVAVFFLLLALIETFGKQRLFLIGLCIGAAFWSRTPVIFGSIFFYIFFWKKFWPINSKNLINLILLTFPILLSIFLDAYYNYLRFGLFSPFAPYELIPDSQKGSAFQNGFMSISAIPLHIDALLFRVPIIRDTFPYLIPSLYATAIWFTSPLIIYALRFRRNLISYASPAAILESTALLAHLLE